MSEEENYFLKKNFKLYFYFFFDDLLIYMFTFIVTINNAKVVFLYTSGLYTT